MNTHEIIALVAMVLSLGSTVVMVLVKSNATLRDRETALRDRELDRRIGSLEAQDTQCTTVQNQHAERLRLDELATERLATRVTVSEHKLEVLDDLVTRNEFEQGMAHLARQLEQNAAHVTKQIDQILTRLQQSSRSGQYQQTNPKPSER